MIDGEGTVVGWTSTAQRLVGYATGEVVGRPAWFVLPFLQNVLRVWAGHRAPPRPGLLVRHNDGPSRRRPHNSM
jgi:PAS domain-containing protein